MRPIVDVRHENLLTLLARYPTVQAFADAVERSHSQISQLKNRNLHAGTAKPRNLDDRLARHIEAKLRLPRGWLDVDRNAVEDWPFPLVERERWERLTEADQVFVQELVNAAIAQREHSLHEPRKRYR